MAKLEFLIHREFIFLAGKALAIHEFIAALPILYNSETSLLKCLKQAMEHLSLLKKLIRLHKRNN